MKNKIKGKSWWNYQIIKHDDNEYCIHEVFYDANNKIEGWTDDSCKPFGETEKELIADLYAMLQDAIKQPVLSLKELEKEFGNKDGGAK